MHSYVTIGDREKLRLLREQTLDGYWPDLAYKNWCLRCNREFDGYSVRVRRNRWAELTVECGTPGCHGTPAEWAPYPWWDEQHPLTRQRQAGCRAPTAPRPKGVSLTASSSGRGAEGADRNRQA
ncbi:MAG: hypothetical protein JXQ71_18030 [Verrucomicrobia bacterium]|nr:hypothetical protein [Verrucomicrobiota bacterium]